MTSNLEQLKKELRGLALKICDLADGRLVPNDILPELREAFALGTLNGLDKAIELLPENIGCDLCKQPLSIHPEENGVYFCPCNKKWHTHTEKEQQGLTARCIIPCPAIAGTEKDIGFNDCRSQILSKIKEEKEKHGIN